MIIKKISTSESFVSHSGLCVLAPKSFYSDIWFDCYGYTSGKRSSQIVNKNLHHFLFLTVAIMIIILNFNELYH